LEIEEVFSQFEVIRFSRKKKMLNYEVTDDTIMNDEYNRVFDTIIQSMEN
jgi:hypothetical protein